MKLTKTDLRREMKNIRECLTRAGKDLSKKGLKEEHLDRVSMHLSDCSHHLSKLKSLTTQLKREAAKAPPKRKRRRK